MLTVETTDNCRRVEIHGDKDGLMSLANYLIDLAESQSMDSAILTTYEWGGNGLSSSKQGFSNELINHLRIVIWPDV